MESAARSGRWFDRRGVASDPRRWSLLPEVPAINSPPHAVGRSASRSEAGWGCWGCSSPHDRELSHVRPVRADLRLDLDARLELVGAGHDSRHRLGKTVDLALGHLEEKLVVYL